MDSSRRPRRGGRHCGALCWLCAMATPLLFVPHGARTGRIAPTQLRAEGDDASAEVAKLKAELELAEARAAAAEAKAALAAAKSGDGEGEGAAQGEDVDIAVEVVDNSMSFSAYAEDERRPAQFLFGPEGRPLFELLDGMESVQEGDSTSLDAILRAWFLSLYQFSARAGDVPEGAPADIRENIREVGGALDADAIASVLLDREKGGDWRPSVKKLSQTRFAKIMDDSLNWEVIFPSEVVTATNVSLPEGRGRVINFLGSDAFKAAGSWSNEEANAAERLIAKDPRLSRVFSRINSVKNSLADNIRSASFLPILALVFFVLFAVCLCNGINADPSFNGLPGQAELDKWEVIGLPAVWHQSRGLSLTGHAAQCTFCTAVPSGSPQQHRQSCAEGKTTVLNALKPKKASLETASGQSRYRSLWEHYYGEVEGIIVVIDSTDKLRFAVVKDELDTMLADPRIAEKKMPILFLNNKVDQPAASPPQETMQALGLDRITDRPWQLFSCDALKGDGVEEAIKWLADNMVS
ncbi:unnamed protein product [Effrenium voratum]|nr:unnamed protein product [Effrenium voratum]